MAVDLWTAAELIFGGDDCKRIVVEFGKAAVRNIRDSVSCLRIAQEQIKQQHSTKKVIRHWRQQRIKELSSSDD